ncbi:hypothetical protein FB45DRAFT_762911, partial [Roridomyces roridus]
LGRRAEGYKATRVDYGAYVQRRDDFLRSPRGHAALFHGGIIGRIARLVLDDTEDLACLEPSDTVLSTGVCLHDYEGKPPPRFSVWHESLTPTEVSLVCGLYTVETGVGQQVKYVSWWPTPTAFGSSGMNTGWWNRNCERWFMARLEEIEASSGETELWTYAQWKSKIRFNSDSPKIAANLDKVAAEYIDSRRLSPAVHTTVS